MKKIIRMLVLIPLEVAFNVRATCRALLEEGPEKKGRKAGGYVATRSAGYNGSREAA
jgi:hypothetical protein